MIFNLTKWTIWPIVTLWPWERCLSELTCRTWKMLRIMFIMRIIDLKSSPMWPEIRLSPIISSLILFIGLIFEVFYTLTESNKIFRNPFQQLEEERKEAEARLEKMKNEMEGVFDLKVKEKIARLKESELNVCVFRVFERKIEK